MSYKGLASHALSSLFPNGVTQRFSWSYNVLHRLMQKIRTILLVNVNVRVATRVGHVICQNQVLAETSLVYPQTLLTIVIRTKIFKPLNRTYE